MHILYVYTDWKNKETDAQISQIKTHTIKQYVINNNIITGFDVPSYVGLVSFTRFLSLFLLPLSIPLLICLSFPSLCVDLNTCWIFVQIKLIALQYKHILKRKPIKLFKLKLIYELKINYPEAPNIRFNCIYISIHFLCLHLCLCESTFRFWALFSGVRFVVWTHALMHVCRQRRTVREG